MEFQICHGRKMKLLLSIPSLVRRESRAKESVKLGENSAWQWEGTVPEEKAHFVYNPYITDGS